MTEIFRNRSMAEEAVEKLKVFAQPQRLMILSFLLDGEHTVGEIDAATGIGQPALSQQLAELRRADLVRTRRQARQVHYALADDSAALCVRALEAIMGGSGDPAAKLAGIAVGPRQYQTGVAATPGSAAFARIG